MNNSLSGELVEPLLKEQVAFMDLALLDKNKRMVPLPHAELTKFEHADLRRWAYLRARYGFITAELIEWLQSQIGSRSAIEIGAGMGDLGYHLKIQMTDSYDQVDNPTTKEAMAVMGQIPTTPPMDVLKLDAVKAVLQLKPDVVIGSWITQKWKPGDKYGNPFGPDETKILQNCKTYIHIGNLSVHGDKRILKGSGYLTYKLPWLSSRALNQDLNRIWVWNQ